MSLAESLAITCTANIGMDLRKDLAVALSDGGFRILSDEIGRRHADASYAYDCAMESLRAAQAALDDIDPVMDMVATIGRMREIAAEFSLSPAASADDMHLILASAARPLDRDCCADRFTDLLKGRETRSERRVREGREYSKAIRQRDLRNPDYDLRADRCLGGEDVHG